VEYLFYFVRQLAACQRLEGPNFFVEAALHEDADQNALHCGFVLAV
jgi:hypothetical protein